MDFDKLTIGDARRLASMFADGVSTSFEVGKSYLIRTLTYHAVGKIRQITSTDIMLDGASWVADSGRFSEAIANGSLEEVEFVGDGFIVAQASIVDGSPWRHELPTSSK